MTTQIRIAKIVLAAMLGGCVSVGGLMLPSRSYAQEGRAVISVEVQPKDRQQAGGCDVTVTVLRGDAEWTFPDGTRRRIRQGQRACVQGGQITVASVGVPPIGSPPIGSGPTGTTCIPQNTPTVINCP